MGDSSNCPRLIKIGKACRQFQMSEWLIGAKRAMDRAIKKELELKRKLGQKVVIWKDRKVRVVDP